MCIHERKLIMNDEIDNMLVTSFSETLLNDSAKELSVDLLESSLDTLFSSEVVKEIPIVKSLIAIGKTGVMLKNRNFIRQTLAFMNELNNGTISVEKKEKFSERIRNGDKKAQEEVERIMLILESTIDLEKSSILAKFVVAYVNENLSYSQFHELTDILNRSYLSDMETLLQIKCGAIEDSTNQELHRIERLAGMGLVHKTLKSIAFRGGYGREDVYLRMSSIGTLFCEIGLLNQLSYLSKKQF